MVFVLNKNKQPLNPCSPAKARKLLKQGKAVIHKRYPFTIRLKKLKDTSTNAQSYRIKFDPGSKTTGISIVKRSEIIFLAELHHKTDIKLKLEARRSFRRARRNRKTRYRKARFLNRTRKKSWIAPSLQARVDNIISWTKRLQQLVPIQEASLELVKFDTQKMQHPEISGVEYQQGELAGYEIREYLLEKFKRTCAYCGIKDVPFEIEHVLAKSRGGSNRVSNLAIACHDCNEEKGNLLLEEWIEKLSKKRTKRNLTIIGNITILLPKLKQSLKDASVVNSTRWKLFNELQIIFDVVECGSGARTKMQRIQHDLPKEHYYDATCVGESTPEKLFFKTEEVLQIKSKGRGSRYRSGTNKYGFPIRSMPKTKYIHGFISGDMIKAIIPNGKYKGIHFGSIAMRSTGRADMRDQNGQRIAQGVDSKYAFILQRFDGYAYFNQKRNEKIRAISPHG